jgi:hypothetical protein
MTPEQIRAYVRNHPIDWPALNPTQRMRLAALLRPDMPVGIHPKAPASNTSGPLQEAT